MEIPTRWDVRHRRLIRGIQQSGKAGGSGLDWSNKKAALEQ